jgi:ABC-type branched-subunit amino acid transport system permease subunit
MLGLLMMLFMIFLPDGIVPSLTRLLQRRSR